MHVITLPGTYVVRPGWNKEKACGVYIAASHDQIVRVDFKHVDVTGANDGLVVVSEI